jgi:hypothetical protein
MPPLIVRCEYLAENFPVMSEGSLRKTRLATVDSTRTNHVQSVVTANCGSKKVLSALTAYATKAMRESGCWQSDESPWSHRGSRRSLWTQKSLVVAIDYVLYDQGPPLPDDV